MLGVRAEFNGLLIDPKIPSAWDRAEITRTFRGAVYEIEIIRTGNKAVYLDGEKTDINILPPLEKGSMHKVVVNI